MSVRRHDVAIPQIPAEELAFWRDIPPAVASDALTRAGAMAGAIKPVAPEMRLCGPARTVRAMVADNSALHAAINLCAPGEVIVVDAEGFEDAALFGGLMCRACMAKGFGGLVIDGAVRDAAEIAEFGFPVFSRAIVPRGPHKNFGGVLDGPIACGGVAVSSGDLILGDRDGVTVVPHAQLGAAKAAAQEILEREAKAEAVVAEGGTLSDLYGAPKVEVI